MRPAIMQRAAKLAVLLLPLLVLLLTPQRAAIGASPMAPLPFLGKGDHRFGVVEGYQAPELAIRSGASWQRVNFWWNELQPTGPTEWKQNNTHVPLGAVDEALAAGQEVIGLVGNPPAWATRNGSVPANLDLPLKDPNNYWAGFLDRLMRTYQGRINTWIIWNEPDVPPPSLISTWAGSPQEYYVLLKTAYQVARAVSPETRVVFAGTTYWGDVWNNRRQFFERTLEQAQKDPTAPANGYYFDAVALHLYNSPYDIYKVGNEFRDIMRRFGLSKPLWLTETNAVPRDDPVYPIKNSSGANLEDQGAYVTQAYAMALAAGMERVSVYKLVDGMVFNGEPFGMARNDGSVRPAYRAYQVAASLFSQTSRAVYQNADGVASVTLTQPGKQTTVLWGSRKTPSTANVPVVGSRARLVDHLGAETALPTKAPGTTYSVPLTPTKHDFMGGPPLILVQEGAGPAIVQMDGGLHFSLTGASLHSRFVEAYYALGGTAVFGQPVGPEEVSVRSKEVLEDRVVQRFERGQLQFFADLQDTLLAVQPGEEKRLPGPGDDPLYFSATEQRVSPLFSDFFKRRGGIEILGYPRTGLQAKDGVLEQHFQRAVLEYLPEFEGTTRAIRIRPLGQQLAQGRQFEPSIRPTPDDTARLHFVETGYSVGLGFLKFFQRHGGAEVFGLPISGELEEVNADRSGRSYIAQYFQNARFEFHPELAGTRYEVQLGLLGDQALRAKGLLIE